MKRKTIYIIFIVCCISLLSSAKQTGKQCDKNKCCEFSKLVNEKKAETRKPVKKAFDLTPMQLFQFSI